MKTTRFRVVIFMSKKNPAMPQAVDNNLPLSRVGAARYLCAPFFRFQSVLKREVCIPAAERGSLFVFVGLILTVVLSNTAGNYMVL